MARQVTLVVEDGTVVANSNSFVNENQIVTYALARGVVLPFTTDTEKDAVATYGILGADYLRILPWRGEVVNVLQTMPFPRKNMDMTPPWPENAIPPAVIEAQLQLALLSNGGTVLIPTSSGVGFLIKEKIGPIENTYSESVGVNSNGLPILPGVSMLLKPWLLGDFEGFIPTLLLSIGGRVPLDGC
jgi:hypothetical protein